MHVGPTCPIEHLCGNERKALSLADAAWHPGIWLGGGTRAGFQCPLPSNWASLSTAWTTIHWVTAWRWNLNSSGKSYILRFLSIPQQVFPLLSKPTRANSNRQWRTGELGVLQFMGPQWVGHDLVTEQQRTTDWMRFTPSVPFSSVQPLSRVWLFATPSIAGHQASLSISNSQSLLKLMPIESVMPSSHLILCRPLLLLPPTPPSIKVFPSESTLRMRWPKYWSFSFSISPSNEHPGLISFRMDWLDLLAVQGTLKSLLQHHGSKTSIFQHSAFFTVQLSHPYMTTGKTIALTRQTDRCWQSNVSAF